MCVAALAWMAHPRWRLVAIGNRDEFHARPAAALARWDNGILAGRDLQAGGTWLGVHDAGRFALVTNRRVEGYPQPGMASRGALVTGCLLGEAIPGRAAMNPFSMFCVNGADAALLTNYPARRRIALDAGIYGLSNGAPEDRWCKTRRLEAALSQWLEGDCAATALLDPLADETPDPADPANAFSAPFIRHAQYGTRCSSVIAVGSGGGGVIIERRFDAAGEPAGDTVLRFQWPAQL